MSPPESAFLASLTDTSLYSIGAYFADQHPELIEDVVAQAQDIQDTGIVQYSEVEDCSLESAFQTLVTGLALRYDMAVAGAGEHEPGR